MAPGGGVHAPVDEHGPADDRRTGNGTEDPAVQALFPVVAEHEVLIRSHPPNLTRCESDLHRVSRNGEASFHEQCPISVVAESYEGKDVTTGGGGKPVDQHVIARQERVFHGDGGNPAGVEDEEAEAAGRETAGGAQNNRQIAEAGHSALRCSSHFTRDPILPGRREGDLSRRLKIGDVGSHDQ